MLMEIQINQDLKRYIRPLSDTEYDGLESSCIDDGIRDPLVIAILPDIKVLADGHNRYEIAKKHGLGFNIIEKKFDSLKEVKAWMLINQLSKRNLTREEESYYRGLRYRLEKDDIGKQSNRGNQYTKVEGPHNGAPLKTSEKIGNELGVSKNTIERDSNYADSIDKIASIVGEDVKNDLLSRSIKSSKKDITELANQEPEKIIEVFKQVKETGQFKEAKDSVLKPHVVNNSGDNEWYTPKKYLEAAREVLGVIDLDPASSDVANVAVMAIKYFSAENSGLEKEWHGRIWMNPPYGQPLMNDFSSKMVKEYNSGNVKEAIVLVNNATETAWFQNMAEISNSICFHKSRIKFLKGNKELQSPLQGQAFLYIGNNEELFKTVFSEFGFIVKV